MVPFQGKEPLQRHHGQTGCQEIDVKGCSYVLMAWSLYTGNVNFSSPELVEYQIVAEVLFAYHNEIFFRKFYGDFLVTTRRLYFFVIDGFGPNPNVPVIRPGAGTQYFHLPSWFFKLI